jgi:hypothetical protein
MMTPEKRDNSYVLSEIKNKNLSQSAYYNLQFNKFKDLELIIIQTGKFCRFAEFTSRVM